VTFEYISRNPQDTLNLGARLGACLQGGEIILLRGDLGAGKTLLTKGIASGLQGNDPVVSPSFPLMNIYKARLDIVHVDLYRLDSDEIWGLGLEDFMDKEHVIVVEWADVARSYFRGPIIDVRIEYLNEDTRKISLEGPVPGEKLNSSKTRF
jgi:tRNA threonylcarbamoyladenosine biosynthesis protein TsaE